MKKLNVLFIPAILVCIVFLAVSYNANAQRRLQKKIIGTWQVCNPDSTVAKNLYNTVDKSRYKVITDETFMLMDFSAKKQINGSLWGTYTLGKGDYTEFVQYTSPDFKNLHGGRYSYKIEIKDDLMIIYGINHESREIWKKVKVMDL